MAKRERGRTRKKSKEGTDFSVSMVDKDSEFFHSHLMELHKYITKHKKKGRDYKDIKHELMQAGWVEHLVDLTNSSLHKPSENKLELKQYIVDCLMTGVTRKQIENILSNAGWDKRLVSRLFIEIQKLNNEMIEKEKKLQDRRLTNAAMSRSRKRKGIHIKDIMIKPVITVQPEATVTHAAHLLDKYRIGCLIVNDIRKRPMGIMTKSDIIRKVVTPGLDPNSVTVDDIMSDEIIYATPDMKIIEISTMMKQYGIKKLPIMEDGKIIGIITTSEIVQLMSY